MAIDVDRLLAIIEQDPDRASDADGLLALLDDVGPKIGRASRPAGAGDLAPAMDRRDLAELSKSDRGKLFAVMKRAGYLMPVDMSMEFLTFAGDDSGYQLTDDGEYGYDDEQHDAAQAYLTDSSGFGNQW